MATSEKAPPNRLSPFDAFFTAWREFRNARVRARLQTRHSLLSFRQQAITNRVANIERMLNQLDGSNTGNGGSSGGGSAGGGGGSAGGGGGTGGSAGGGGGPRPKGRPGQSG